MRALVIDFLELLLEIPLDFTLVNKYDRFP